MAVTTSWRFLISGNWKSIGRPLRFGAMRSKAISRHRTLPPVASSISFLAIFSASPSTRCSTNRVVWFFAPGGRPGFPGWKGRPRTLGSIFCGSFRSRVCIFFSTLMSLGAVLCGLDHLHSNDFCIGKGCCFQRFQRHRPVTVTHNSIAPVDPDLGHGSLISAELCYPSS